MIKMVSVVCPECRANLEIAPDRKMCYCQYCGTKVMIDDGSTTHTYRKIDEARIKEAEIKEVIRLKELELEEKKRIASERTKIFKGLLKTLKILFSIILGIIGALFIALGFSFGAGSGNADSSVYFVTIIGFICIAVIVFIW